MATCSDILLYGPTFSCYTLINYVQRREITIPSTVSQVASIKGNHNSHHLLFDLCCLRCWPVLFTFFCMCCLFFSACAVYFLACAVHFFLHVLFTFWPMLFTFFAYVFQPCLPLTTLPFHLGPTSHLSQLHCAK